MSGTGASRRAPEPLHLEAGSPAGIAAVEMRTIKNGWQRGSFGARARERLYNS
jgi:hypothetical protein